MNLKDCESILAAGGAVTCPHLKGAYVKMHDDKKRLIIHYPKGHHKYPDGTYRLYEEDGHEKSMVASNWSEINPKKEEG